MTDLARATALLTIDVAAIVANWKRLSALVAPAEASAVVKADCYGLGMEHIAPALSAAGCQSFFVACVNEGIALRRILPAAVIHVLSGPLGGDEGEFAAHNLIPVLNSLAQITGWAGFAKKGSGAPAAAIHIDTGMNRLGLSETELERLAAKPEITAAIRPILVMSHLACADDADSPMNARQLTTLRRLASHLPALPQSIAASSGIFLGRGFHLGLVRPGAALYGLNPMPGRPNPMSQVVKLQGKIVQVRDVDSPQTVGYGATHRVEGKRKLAVVAVGYADGWFRSLSNRGHGMIGGMKVPVAGRISMDLTTFDVTDVPAEHAHPGAWIELIGPDLSPDRVADEAGTIGYEILTSLGRRHHRRWTGTETAKS
ncbi:Alanine racemase [Paramagnetospirillum magnetotacticum MS-1]|uniref:Alanine racemase n=1 Tax=Paramagnetospirillum magnetotacticum MS-1 TaxID=272627 RepID=A0A0C2YV18_PARME|nr:alanine racemase [Paramagnetospirillum magnetotacticum]KIL98545.1 Alanine racemase [Paramagnetospirillum magnetotacticum MS-1]